jgi:hypothetical protein
MFQPASGINLSGLITINKACASLPGNAHAPYTTHRLFKNTQQIEEEKNRNRGNHHQGQGHRQGHRQKCFHQISS